MTFKWLRSLTLCLALAALAGCAVDDAIKKISQVILDPQIEVGPQEEQPATIVLHAYASAEMNPNFKGDPAPATLKIIALGSDHLFLSSDFFSLSLDMEMTLSKTMIELVSEEQVVPDSYKILGPFDVPKGTKRIGVMADFVDFETSVWRDTIVVEEMGETNEIILLLLDGEVRLVEKEE